MWEKTKNGNPKFRIKKKDGIYMSQMYCPSTLMDRWIDGSISVMGIYVKWVAIQGGLSQTITSLTWYLGGPAIDGLCHCGCYFACVFI